jgi:hypothetical protein
MYAMTEKIHTKTSKRSNIFLAIELLCKKTEKGLSESNIKFVPNDSIRLNVPQAQSIKNLRAI